MHELMSILQSCNLSRQLAYFHVLISILAFLILGMAALQAALLSWQNRLLRNKVSPGLIRIFPPLQTMETLFFQMIWFGFLLLTASLFSAFLFLDAPVFAHHRHKIILSVLAWGLFAALLYGHHQSGFRGSSAIRWTLIGVGLVTTAYLANKVMQMEF